MIPRRISRWFLPILCVACIGSIPLGKMSPTSVIAQGACSSTYCVWLPFVANALPVTINFSSSPTSVNNDIFGTVTTTSNQPVYNVTLEVRRFDVNNQLLGTSVLTPTFVATLPGQANPFFGRPPLCCQAGHIELRVRSGQLVNSQSYVALTVTQLAYTSGNFKVSVQNTYASPIHDLVIVVRERGFVPHVKRVDVLAPNATVIFEDTITDFLGLSGVPGWAQGYIQP